MTKVLKPSDCSNRSLAKASALLKDDDVRCIIRDYVDGQSENALAKRFGVSRRVIGRHLLAAGIRRRGRSEAEKLKWETIKQSREAVERQCGAAWAGCIAKGRAQTEKILELYECPGNGGKTSIAAMVGCSPGNVRRVIKKFGVASDVGVRRAAGRELSPNPGCASAFEIPLLEALRGHNPVHQKRIASYNVDIAFPEVRVAVELERRHISESKSLRAERLKKIFDLGWRVLIINDHRRLGIDYAAVSEQTVRFVDIFRSNPSSPGQYGVIGRDGKPMPCSRRYFNGAARVEGF